MLNGVSSRRWTMPIGLGVTKTVRIGKRSGVLPCGREGEDPAPPFNLAPMHNECNEI